MIFKGLKERALRKGIDAQISKRTAAIRSSVLEIKTLAVLINASKPVDITSVVKLSSELGVRSEGLKVIGYKDDLKAQVAGEESNNYFSGSSIGVRGGIKNNFVSEFVNKEYDVLINFYTDDNLLINYIASASRAKFKVGFAEVDNRINDLIIGSSHGNSNVFIAELKKYLKILKII